MPLLDTGDTPIEPETAPEDLIAGLLSDELVGDTPDDEEPTPADDADETDDDSDSPSPEESDPDADDADPDEEEPSDEEELPTPRKRTLKVPKAGDNGEDLDVDEEEVVKGYLRQSDYTRKTQKLAERAKQLEQVEAETRGAREQYLQRLIEVSQRFASVAEQEPNWAELRQKLEPGEYAVQLAEWNQFKQERAAIEAERARVEQEALSKQMQAYAAHLAEQEAKMLENIPEWRAPEARAAGMQELKRYAMELGFSEQEIDSIADHRAVLLLKKAAAFDKAMAAAKSKAKVVAKPAVTKPAVKVATPDATPKVRRASSFDDKQKLRQQLKRTGRDDVAASLIEKLL